MGVVIAVTLTAVVIGDPGGIDRQSTRLRMVTDVLIAMMLVANAASAVSLVSRIKSKTTPLTAFSPTDVAAVPWGTLLMLLKKRFRLWSACS